MMHLVGNLKLAIFWAIILGQTRSDLQREWQRDSSFPSVACAAHTEPGCTAALAGRASASAGELLP